MNLKFLSEQMGTSVAMIDKHYGHVEVSEIVGEIAKKPAPELHWYRLFTGRAVQRDGDGKVVRSAMPGAYDYPSPLEFVNWN